MSALPPVRMLRGMMQIPTSSAAPPRPVGWAPFALGFRPFFLLAGLGAALFMLVWLATLHGALGAPVHYDPLAWHAHEMLFGYTVAVIAGFLLTAVRNWTGIDTWSGGRLAFLAGLWLLGRLLPWIPEFPVVAIVLVDIAFLPLLAISLVRPLWLGKDRVNRVFLLLLAAMSLANLLSHLQLLGMATGFGDAGRVMLDLVLLLIVLVAGRVLPFFTRNVIPGFEPVTRKWVEQMSFLGIVLIATLEALQVLPMPVLGSMWLLFGVLQIWRLGGWFDRRALGMPVLWILHAGYAWLCLGALLRGAALLGLFPETAALHALTAGAVGVFTLGMMARVSRGHTGRDIAVSRVTAIAFVIVNAAVVVRVFAPVVVADRYALWLDLSGGLWAFAFALFAMSFAPMLLRTRADGRPG